MITSHRSSFKSALCLPISLLSLRLQRAGIPSILTVTSNILVRSRDFRCESTVCTEAFQKLGLPLGNLVRMYVKLLGKFGKGSFHPSVRPVPNANTERSLST